MRKPLTHPDQILNTFGWLMIPMRRPGALGCPARIEGRRANGEPAVLEAVGERWAFVGETEPRRMYEPHELIAVMAEEFRPLRLHLKADFASEFFAAAVRHLDRGDAHFAKAVGHSAGVASGHGDIDPMAWVMWAGEVDRAMTEAASAILLALATAEAQANAWADAKGVSRTDARSGRSQPALIDALIDVAATAGHVVQLGRGPFQELRFAVDQRNDLVHARGIKPIDLRAAPFVPGLAQVVDARRCVRGVRLALVEVARALGELTGVRYLASCPLSDPNDHEEWRSAYIRSGLRADPDFPREDAVAPQSGG